MGCANSTEAPFDVANGKPLTTAALAQLFVEARTHNGFLDKPVSDQLLQEVYNLAKMGPTALNCQPARFLFLRSQKSKEQLRPALMEGNVEKTLKAPIVVVVCTDPKFYDHLPEQFKAFPARDMFASNADMAKATEALSGHLQAAYFMLAARSLGLSCGPMSGFDNATVDKTFFPDGSWKSTMLINLGYGDAKATYPRGPRLDFTVATKTL